MWKLVLFLLATLTAVTWSKAHRILLIAPTNSKSHAILSEGLIRHLTKAGHEITYIPAILPEKPLPGVTLIDISDIVFPTDEFLNPKSFMDKKFDLDVATGFIPHILEFSKQLIEHPNVQKLIADKSQHFDLVIAEFILNTIHAGWISRCDNEVYEKNFVTQIRERRTNVPSLETLAYNGSLVLSNHHISMSICVPAPPNHISIGGFHIDQNVKPLSQDLQKLMDDAKHGVIYFSLGSNIKSKHFPSEVKRDLLKMFGKLKQTVVWKFEEDLPNRPTNVHILHWTPQQSILAHKNCIIFITHGGLLSTTEAIHFGVPIIGIPAFYDQFLNVQRSVNMGYGKKVDLSYTIAKDLELAIQDVLDDPKYTAKIHELSEIYQDRPVPPGKELVHWVEHVIKTRGAPHLRSPAFLTPWYQKLYLDLALVLLLLVLVLKFTFRFMFGFKKTNLVTKEKHKKKIY